jgi:8-oxo-dGTP diphosphatase
MRGVALRLFSVLPQEFRDLVYYAASTKLGVSVLAVIPNSVGSILLAHHPYKAPVEWSLPGGLLGARETPEAGVVREVVEELGIDVEVQRCLAARRRAPFRMELFFECRITGGSPGRSIEVDAMRYFPPVRGQLPTNLDPVHREAVVESAHLI